MTRDRSHQILPLRPAEVARIAAWARAAHAKARVRALLPWRNATGSFRAPSLGARAVLQRADPNRIPEMIIKPIRNDAENKISGRNFRGVDMDKVESRHRRSFSPEKEAQFLRHISAFFYFYANEALKKADAEVEAMYVNDRLVIAANNPRTMEQLYQLMLKEPSLLDVLRSVPITKGDRRGERVIGRMQDEVMSEDTASAPQALLQGLASSKLEDVVTVVNLERSGPKDKDKGDVLVNEAFRNMVVMVTGLDIHAEQKLLLLLINSKLPKRDPVVIRGKKRPCFGCFLCLKFVKESLGYQLDYNRRPGKAWLAPIDELSTFIKYALKNQDSTEISISKWVQEVMTQEKVTYVSTNTTGKKDPAWDTESDDD